MMKYFFVLVFLFSVFLISSPEISHAQGILSAIPCADTGDCTPENIIDLIDNIVKWGASVAGAIALLMYILGGVWMLFSGGSSTRVERGKNILTGTTIALIFILGSWLIINFTLTALRPTEIVFEERLCGDKICDLRYQYCKDGATCQDICLRKHAIDKTLGNIWECVDDFCGRISREACEGDEGYCELNLCGGGPDRVCCLIEEAP